MEFRINARIRLDFLVIVPASTTAETQREPGAWPVLANTDNMHRNALSEETERSCTEAALKSHRKVVVPALVTENLTEPRVDVDAWRPPGLPHMRLDFTIVHAEALQNSSAIRKGQDEVPGAAQAERAKTNEYGKSKGGVGVTGISLQLNERFGPELDTLLLAGYQRAVSKAAGRDGGRPLQELRKLLSVALAKHTAATILSALGHKARRGTWCALAHWPCFLCCIVQNHSL